MNLKNKNLLPYYIVAILIIVCAVISVVLIGVFINNKDDETTTQPEIITEFMNGEVPYYDNIPASSYLKEEFTEIDGRMTYSDTSVNYSTGIDVSSYQGNIDWHAVAKDGIDFAIIRVGYRGYGTAGNICVDDSARTNIKEAKAAGLKVGVYFYSQATSTLEAVEEAEFVLEAIKDYEIDFPVIFDWENDPGVGMRTDNMASEQITACAVAFCEKIKEAGYTPGVYFNLTDAYERYNLEKINDYVFWYAQFKGESPEFYYQYNIWQYANDGTVEGISGTVDLNICFSSY